MRACQVFVSMAEHHSNLLPWREAGATLVTIPEVRCRRGTTRGSQCIALQTADGLLDLVHLEAKLVEVRAQSLDAR